MRHDGRSWTAVLAAGLLAATVPATPAAATGPAGLSVLGAGWANDVNGRGDILGYATTEGNPPIVGSYAVWSGSDRSRTTLNLPWTGHTDRADLTERGDAAVRGLVWRAGRLTTLTSPGGEQVVTTAMNEHGAVAGYRISADRATEHAFVWRDGVFTDFPDPPGTAFSYAIDINNLGQVLVTTIDDRDYAAHAAVWWHGRVTDLGSLGGGFTEAEAINDRGTVIGLSDDGDHVLWPFVWRAGVLSKPAGAVADGTGVAALNARGDLAGHIGFTPVRWRGGAPTALAPGRTGRATALNARGDVAGVLTDEVNGVTVRSLFRWRNGELVTYALPEQPSSISVDGLDLSGRLVATAWFERPVLHATVYTTS